MNAAILDEWSTNDDLSFQRNDEDIFLSFACALPLLQQYVQRQDISDDKRATLLCALCVIVQENTFDPSWPDPEVDPELGNAVVAFLQKNAWLFTAISNGRDLLEAFPQIGVDLKDGA